MATTMSTTRKYPKRKRAEVSYYEGFSDHGEMEDDDLELDDAPAGKVGQ